jgi:hypothetical protein
MRLPVDPSASLTSTHAPLSVSPAAGQARSVIATNGGTLYRPDGKDLLLLCCQGTTDIPSNLSVVDPTTGESHCILNNYHGRPFNAINDVVVLPPLAKEGEEETHTGRTDLHGHEATTIWWTDPTYASAQGYKGAPQLPNQVCFFHGFSFLLPLMFFSLQGLLLHSFYWRCPSRSGRIQYAQRSYVSLIFLRSSTPLPSPPFFPFPPSSFLATSTCTRSRSYDLGLTLAPFLPLRRFFSLPVCFSPSGDLLYVTDTGLISGDGNLHPQRPGTIYVYDVVRARPGSIDPKTGKEVDFTAVQPTLSNRRVFAFCDAGVPCVLCSSLSLEVSLIRPLRAAMASKPTSSEMSTPEPVKEFRFVLPAALPSSLAL